MRQTNLRTRILQSVSAHSYAQAVTVLCQLLTLPIFIKYLGIEAFGQWLILSAGPLYIALADLGTQSAGGTAMSIAEAQKNREASRNIFQSMQLTALITIPFFTILVFIICNLYSDGTPPPQRTETLLLLCISSALTCTSGMFDAIYRSKGKAASITTMLSHARLVEWLASVAGVALFPSLFAAAFGLAVGRAASQLAILLVTIKVFPNLEWGISFATAARIRKITTDGIGIMLLLASSIATLQGTIITIGAIGGPLAAATFNIHRVLSRILIQVAAVISKSVSPELSLLHGATDRVRFDQVRKRATKITMCATGLLGLLLLVVGESFIDKISQHTVTYEPKLYALLILAGWISAFWQVEVVSLTAINRHSDFAVNLLIFTAISIVVIYGMNLWIGLLGVGLSLVMFEASTVFLAKNSLRKL